MDYESQTSYRQRHDSNASTESTRSNNYRRTYHRVRLQTEALHASCAQTGHLEAFQENVRMKNRTTNLEEEKLRNIDYDESILGMVIIHKLFQHLKLVLRRNAINRFIFGFNSRSILSLPNIMRCVDFQKTESMINVLHYFI